ncbi:MAG: hypothetical protein IJU69_04950 [Bacteroidales bacterium]|nr:hypothetical protein [Bacteroidales bacterium]
MNHSKSYQSPLCEIVEERLNECILEASYNYGGAGTYTDEEIIDNGRY